MIPAYTGENAGFHSRYEQILMIWDFSAHPVLERGANPTPLPVTQHLTCIDVFTLCYLSTDLTIFKLAVCAVTRKKPLLDTSTSHVSCVEPCPQPWQRQQQQQGAETDQPDWNCGQLRSSLRQTAKRSALASPPLTARWVIRLARGQRLPALRADAGIWGGRQWHGPEGEMEPYGASGALCWNGAITGHFCGDSTSIR